MYCTVGEVLEMIKDDMKNVIIGDEYIEDEQEREAKIATLCDFHSGTLHGGEDSGRYKLEAIHPGTGGRRQDAHQDHTAQNKHPVRSE